MRKGPAIAVMIGMPSPHGEDEDSLDRKQDGNGDDDIATEAICSIATNLHRGGPSAVRDLRKFTRALEEMCEAFMHKDSHGFEEAAHSARDALHDMIGE